jgi:hypothetical protein
MWESDMSDAIRYKIRKLLALAGNNPNEFEAATALKKAHDMMLEYGITELGEDGDGIDVIKGTILEGFQTGWHAIVGNACSMLYGCKYARFRTGGERDHTAFIGVAYQLEAAEETFVFIVTQIEQLYKIALKAFDGNLTKKQRAELRASFKDAAAIRIGLRIATIVKDRKSNKNALVVIDKIADKINGILDGKATVTQIAIREGFGTGVGFNAGGLVQIQKEVK